MKRESKPLIASPRLNQEKSKLQTKMSPKSSNREQIALQRSPKDRLRSKYNYASPSNKENQQKSANQQQQVPFSPCSPLQCTSPMSPQSSSSFQLQFNSPSRTTPLQTLNSLRSNKGKETIQQESQNKILFSGFSKDGKYKVQSRALQGQQLVKACEYERKINVVARMQSKKQSNAPKIPHVDQARTSQKQNGFIKSYAVNTHQGISRNYNEDRVSITLNIKKKGIKAQFFAVYDGHGGNQCCDYLKDNLHQFVINNSFFPADPKRALSEAIFQAQYTFAIKTKKSKDKDNNLDRSGSCAIVVLIVDDTCYVANVGDSRAIMSTEGGKLAFNLSRDHRPCDIREQERILSAGGKIYRTEMSKLQNNNEKVIGPLRILPGKLSVSRTLGDIQAKDTEFGGRKGIISSEPDIRKFKLTGKEDFILLCCDGILERLESMEIVDMIWSSFRKEGSMHEKAGKAVDSLITESMRRRSADNLTAILVCLRQLGEETYKSPRKSEYQSR